jgi:hypothetical protein
MWTLKGSIARQYSADQLAHALAWQNIRGPDQAASFRAEGLARAPGGVEETTLTYAEFSQWDEIFSSANYSKLARVPRLASTTARCNPAHSTARPALYLRLRARL